MFTGIVQGIGHVLRIEAGESSALLTIETPNSIRDFQFGDSISVNGICLTVSECAADRTTFSSDVMGVTLRLTNLGSLELGDPVNLELAMAVNERFGGHLVSGHIDHCVNLLQKSRASNWETFRFQLPQESKHLIVKRGSVCLNGVSLTVSDIGSDWFEVSLIPTTLENTNLGSLQEMDAANLELDILAKYVESIMEKKK